MARPNWGAAWRAFLHRRFAVPRVGGALGRDPIFVLNLWLLTKSAMNYLLLLIMLLSACHDSFIGRIFKRSGLELNMDTENSKVALSRGVLGSISVWGTLAILVWSCFVLKWYICIGLFIFASSATGYFFGAFWQEHEGAITSSVHATVLALRIITIGTGICLAYRLS